MDAKGTEDKALRSPDERNLLQFSSFTGLEDNLQSPRRRFCRVMTEISGSKGPQPFFRAITSNDLSQQGSTDSQEDAIKLCSKASSGDVPSFNSGSGGWKKHFRGDNSLQRPSSNGEYVGPKRKFFNLSRGKGSGSQDVPGKHNEREELFESVSSKVSSPAASPREIVPKHRTAKNEAGDALVDNLFSEDTSAKPSSYNKSGSGNEAESIVRKTSTPRSYGDRKRVLDGAVQPKASETGTGDDQEPESYSRLSRKPRSLFSRAKPTDDIPAQKSTARPVAKHSFSPEGIQNYGEDGTALSNDGKVEGEPDIDGLPRKKGSLRDFLSRLRSPGSSGEPYTLPKERRSRRGSKDASHSTDKQLEMERISASRASALSPNQHAQFPHSQAELQKGINVNGESNNAGSEAAQTSTDQKMDVAERAAKFKFGGWVDGENNKAADEEFDKKAADIEKFLDFLSEFDRAN